MRCCSSKSNAARHVHDRARALGWYLIKKNQPARFQKASRKHGDSVAAAYGRGLLCARVLDRRERRAIRREPARVRDCREDGARRLRVQRGCAARSARVATWTSRGRGCITSPRRRAATETETLHRLRCERAPVQQMLAVPVGQVLRPRVPSARVARAQAGVLRPVRWLRKRASPRAHRCLISDQSRKRPNAQKTGDVLHRRSTRAFARWKKIRTHTHTHHGVAQQSSARERAS